MGSCWVQAFIMTVANFYLNVDNFSVYIRLDSKSIIWLVWEIYGWIFCMVSMMSSKYKLMGWNNAMHLNSAWWGRWIMGGHQISMVSVVLPCCCKTPLICVRLCPLFDQVSSSDGNGADPRMNLTHPRPWILYMPLSSCCSPDGKTFPPSIPALTGIWIPAPPWSFFHDRKN